MKVRLLKQHTHAGVEHEPGAVLELDRDQAEWLIANGIAEPAKKTQKSTQGE